MPDERVNAADLPLRLTDDAIVEAMCQVQFSSDVAPEIIIGRLSDLATDKTRPALRRLPLADVPAPIRRQDPAFSRQPLIELRYGDGRLIRIGEGVLSAHVVGPKRYPGWDTFRGQIHEVFGPLFDRVPDVKVSGASLRYINAIVSSRHFVQNAHELNISVAVAGERVTSPMNLNVQEQPDSSHVVTTRVAHPVFVQGEIPQGTAVIVDVEVSTVAGYATGDRTTLYNWISDAHALEKKAFFRLIPRDVVNKLTGD